MGQTVLKMDIINQNIVRQRFWAIIMLSHFEIRMSQNQNFCFVFSDNRRINYARQTRFTHIF